MAYCHVADVGMKFDEHVYYMAALFCANIAASVALLGLVAASGRLPARGARLVWSSAGALAALTIAGLVWSRTIGFPQMADHIGEWDALGLSSLAFESVVVATTLWVLAGSPVLAWSGALAATALVVLAVAAPSHAAARMPHMEMVGNMRPYPDLRQAGRRNVRRARHLLHASLRSASAFDTLVEARRRGYRATGWHRPGFTHLRKNGVRFWGRVFDARAPQAVLVWCPADGRCTLTTYMYRAPIGAPPSTWHDLLQWHRHGRKATWMTHVWLVPRTRDAFATCAPWPALKAEYGLTRVAYRAIKPDRPCPEQAPAMSGN